MKKCVTLMISLLLLLGVIGSALAEVAAPSISCDGHAADSRVVYDHDLGDGSLVVSWAKQASASKYYYKCIGLNEVPDFNDSYQANRGTILAEKTVTSQTTSSRKFTISTTKMKSYSYLKIAIAAYDSDGNASWKNFGVRITDEKGNAGIPVFDDYATRGIYDFDISSTSTLRIDYSATNADAYYIKAILLNEEPSSDAYQSDRAVGEVYINEARSPSYVKLSTSKMTGAKYMKVAVGAYGTSESPDTAHWAWIGFRLTDGSAKDFSLSNSSLNLSYTGGSSTITVNGASSYTVSYPTENETVAGKKWMTVTKNGNDIKVTARPNYGTSSRKETITVTGNNGQQKTITVTQGAGYAAPQASIKVGNTAYQSGDTYGPLANGGEDILWLYVEAKNAQRVHVDCNNTTIGSFDTNIAMSSSTTSTECAFRIPKGVAPDTYTFTIYVSNSDVRDDEWRQQVEPMKLKVNVIDPNADPYPARGSTLLEVARSQIGYKGSSDSKNITGANVENVGDYTKYGVYTGENGKPWCASFVAWCAAQAKDSRIKKTAGASPALLCSNAYSENAIAYFEITELMKSNHPYVEKYGVQVERGFKPSVGDLIFFNTNRNNASFTHVGIVSGVSGSTIYYIDGNGSGDVVMERSVSATASKIACFCKVSGSYSASSAVTPNPSLQPVVTPIPSSQPVVTPNPSLQPVVTPPTFTSDPGPAPCAHEAVTWVQTIAATCTTEGVEESRCQNCGATIATRAIAAKGHTAGEWKVVTAATESSTGLRQQACTVCGTVVKEETIPMTACSHSSVAWVQTKAATCTAEGIEESRCQKCGATVSTRAIAAKGHTAGEWKIVTAATESSTGLKQQACMVCGTVLAEEIIPALTPAISAITLRSNAVSGAPGQSVTAAVSMQNPDNDVLGTLNLEFALPDGITLGEVKPCGIAANASVIMSGNPTIIIATGGIQGSGQVVDISFALSGNVALPSKVTVYPTVVTLQDEKQFTLNSFTINIQPQGTNRIPGDVTGDGNVNFADLLRLAKHLANWTGITINEANADCTGDGKINFADLLRLAKYLANWDVTLE